MKRILCRASIILTLLMIYIMYMDCITISIPQIGLYIDYVYLKLIFTILVILWISNAPLRKSCCNGRWTEVVFNLVPLEVLLFLMYSQWHFVSAVVITLLFGVLVIAFKMYLLRDESKNDYDIRLHIKYKHIYRRATLLVLSVLLALPSCLVAFKYDCHSPNYVSRVESLAEVKMSDSDEEDDIYMENMHIFNSFKESKWQAMGVQEKVTCLQNLANFETQVLGVPNIKIVVSNLPLYTLGAYSDIEKEIHLDIEHVAKSDVEECIKSIIHEVFHSFQHYVVDNVNWNNTVTKTQYFEELRDWKNNLKDYKSGSEYGYDIYANQTVEIAAREYAEEETQKILLYIVK